MNISLCIATYRRADRLQILLDDLVCQRRPPNEVVVVDNDATGSARSVVERRRELGTPFPIHYDIQPVKNISLTRNRTVELASGDWIAFIDDDERAPAAWLAQLNDAANRYNADGVLGPVSHIQRVVEPLVLVPEREVPIEDSCQNPGAVLRQDISRQARGLGVRQRQPSNDQ